MHILSIPYPEEMQVLPLLASGDTFQMHTVIAGKLTWQHLFYEPELQIKGGTEDNSKIRFLISQ